MESLQHDAKGREARRPSRAVIPRSDRPRTAASPGAARGAGTRLKVRPTHPNAPGRFQALHPVTTVEARIDVGFGNALFIRGRGDGLSWDKGLPLTCLDASRWVWNSDRARGRVIFKLLLNDRCWAEGEDLGVEAGGSIEVVPTFT